MYYYSIKQLKANLTEGPLPENESVSYIIGFSAIAALTKILPAPTPSTWHYINFIISLLLAFFGTYWIYLQNGGPNGKNFIQRYVILGWVSAIRYITLALPAFIILLAATHYFMNAEGVRAEWIYHPAISAFEALFYVYFGRQFSDLTRKQSHGNSPKS